MVIGWLNTSFWLVVKCRNLNPNWLSGAVEQTHWLLITSTQKLLVAHCDQGHNNKNDNNLFVNVNTSYFELIILESNSLTFYNRFEYSNKEDFIYFILFTIEQLDLNVQKINSTFNNLELHNILFSGNYELEFKSIFELNSIYNDPTVYINITSKDVPKDAPKGCENWFVMINCPNDNGQNWDKIVKS